MCGIGGMNLVFTQEDFHTLLLVIVTLKFLKETVAFAQTLRNSPSPDGFFLNERDVPVCFHVDKVRDISQVPDLTLSTSVCKNTEQLPTCTSLRQTILLLEIFALNVFHIEGNRTGESLFKSLLKYYISKGFIVMV